MNYCVIDGEHNGPDYNGDGDECEKEQFKKEFVTKTRVFVVVTVMKCPE